MALRVCDAQRKEGAIKLTHREHVAAQIIEIGNAVWCGKVSERWRGRGGSNEFKDLFCEAEIGGMDEQAQGEVREGVDAWLFTGECGMS